MRYKLSEIEKRCRALERQGFHSIEDFPFVCQRVEMDLDTLPAPMSEPVDMCLKDALQQTLDTLNEQEAYVLRMRFFQGKTLREIGLEFGVQQERIRQIECKALRKMRNPIRLQHLQDFFDDFSL